MAAADVVDDRRRSAGVPDAMRELRRRPWRDVADRGSVLLLPPLVPLASSAFASASVFASVFAETPSSVPRAPSIDMDDAMEVVDSPANDEAPKPCLPRALDTENVGAGAA